jgi:5-oxoprolinase (ATP-hydrolysing)
VFGPRGDEALDGESSPRASPRSRARSRGDGKEIAPEAVAAGFVDIAVGSMANAIKKISVARGYDVTRYTLQCFGGAGGQHACLVADALAMERVYIHPLAGVLSAYGMGLADQTVMRQAALEQPLAGAHADVEARWTALADDAVAELVEQGVARERIVVHRRVHLRYEGTDSALVVAFADEAGLQAAFEAAYRQRFAFLMSERA